MQKTVTVYSDTASATYNVQACADSAKGVTESVESNNCGLADGVLTVLGPSAGHSDLVVTAVTDPPATALASTSFQVAATVDNQGTGSRAPDDDQLPPREHEHRDQEVAQGRSERAGAGPRRER